MEDDIYTRDGINYLSEEEELSIEEEGFMLGYIDEDYYE